jgi:hypothetical protein
VITLYVSPHLEVVHKHGGHAGSRAVNAAPATGNTLQLIRYAVLAHRM